MQALRAILISAPPLQFRDDRCQSETPVHDSPRVAERITRLNLAVGPALGYGFSVH
ncbi:hypothetical protein MPL3365_170004 [Mesorhizobium plurifarium]|uniref:Uncharacterized protein n=1 Tax=Mesorhizobium plurifarium TaxID=69974 RepID=A0A090FYU9_MESPL|nr:hypothetical protein MPL3365_170004 [Mesorhizobium plurifarium]